MARYDTAVINGTLVVPYSGTSTSDIGIRDGKIVALSDRIAPGDAERVIDAKGKVVLPGAADSHFHLGIYRPMGEDTESETRSALVGGVTTVLSYFRTGSNYLNKSGPYKAIFPEVLAATQGRAFTDFGFHIAVMTGEQLDEVDWLVAEQGVASFKNYMFYRGLNLTSDSTQASAYTMAEKYDLGHLFLLMERVSQSSARYGKSGRVSLSIHCEDPDLLRIGIEEGQGTGQEDLKTYSEALLTLAEVLAINEAAVLANAASCPVNLLHLSSRDALSTATEVRGRYPGLDVRVETTLHHLALTHDTARGIWGKVNPPIREADDQQALWDGVFAGQINTVASDHACLSLEDKSKGLWSSQPGFGGTSLLYPVLLSEGYHRRGLPLARVAELVSANPAQNFGLYPTKGTIAVGSDADLAIVDLETEREVTTELLLSAQDFTPFEGLRVKGWPTHTILRGQPMLDDGEVVGEQIGRYIRRPVALHSQSQ